MRSFQGRASAATTGSALAASTDEVAEHKLKRKGLLIYAEAVGDDGALEWKTLVMKYLLDTAIKSEIRFNSALKT